MKTETLTCLSCGKELDTTDCGLPKHPGCPMNDRLRELELSAIDAWESMHDEHRDTTRPVMLAAAKETA